MYRKSILKTGDDIMYRKSILKTGDDKRHGFIL